MALVRVISYVVLSVVFKNSEFKLGLTSGQEGYRENQGMRDLDYGSDRLYACNITGGE